MRGVIEKDIEKRKRLENFEVQRRTFDKNLNEFTESAQTAIGEKEDQGRTLSMNDEATAKQVSDLLLDMFQIDLPVLYRASALQVFLIQIQDLLKGYLAETDIEKLADHRETFESLSKKIKSRLRRLKRKLKTHEHLESHGALTNGFEDLSNSILSEGGLFDVHYQYLEATEAIKSLKKGLKKATDNVNAALNSVVRKSRQMNTDIQASTKKEVSSALWYIGFIVFIGLIAAGLAAVMIIRSITRPLMTLQHTVSQVDKGVENADKTAEGLNKIHTIVGRVNRLVEDVSISSKEQNENIEAINAGLSEMNDAVSDNAAIGKETAKSYEELSRLSTQMHNTLEKFILSK